MKRRQFLTLATTVAAGSVALKLPGEPAPGKTENTRSAPKSVSSRAPKNTWKRQPRSTREKVALRYPPSDAEQWLLCFAASESHPGRVIIGQDMGGIWFSPEAGDTWFTLPNEGLGTINIQSVAIDPLDPNRWLAQCIRRTRGGRQGLFLTTDGGMTWKRVMPWEQGGETPQHCRRIAHAPSTRDTTRGVTRRWYAAWDSWTVRYEKAHRGIPGLVMSDDGGETWTCVRSLPMAEFGETINSLRVHPDDASRVYAWGQKGLFCFTDAPRADGAVEWISGKNGLPAGACIGNLYISPDGQTFIQAVSRQGIFKSTDGGRSWNSLYAWPHIASVWVNEAHPDTLFALSGVNGLGEDQARVSHDGGKTWFSGAQASAMPGEEASVWTTQVGGETKCFVYSDPRDPQKALALGRARWFRTENGGRTWTPANTNFAGNQFTCYPSPQIFDPANPLRYMIPTLDVGAVYTEDGGKTLLRCGLNFSKLGVGHSSSKAGAMHVDPVKRTLLLSAGSSTSGAVVRSTDNGATWTVVRPDRRRRMFIGFDAGQPDVCYQYNERSTDSGATWTTLVNQPPLTSIMGISPTPIAGRSVLYAIDVDKVGEQEGTFRQIWKSLDGGESWLKAATADYRLRGFDAGTIFRIHPKNPHMIYTRAAESATSQVREWDTSRTSVVTRDLAILEPGKVPSDLRLMNVAPDPVNPAVMYALLNSDEAGNRVHMTTDGGATWSDITAGLPLCTERSGLEVHPLTGVVYIGSGAGMFVRKPPYAVPTEQNTWDILDRAFPNWTDSHLYQTYSG